MKKTDFKDGETIKTDDDETDDGEEELRDAKRKIEALADNDYNSCITPS